MLHMAFKQVTIIVENKNLSPMPFVIDQVVIHVCYGLRKIMALQQLKLAYLKHLNMMIFCTFRFEKSLLELLWLEISQN